MDPDSTSYDRTNDAAYVGAVCGRVCGRIANGQYTRADGSDVQLSLNEGKHHLHGGGPGALNRLIWYPANPANSHAPSSLTFKAISPTGSEGYPGNLDAEITYTLTNDSLIAELRAVCDEPCPINLTLHPYFNLATDKSLPISAHHLSVSSKAVYLLDRALVPSGELQNISGTDQYFSPSREIGDQSLDTIYSLNGNTPAATLSSPSGDLVMKVETDRDTLVVYDGSGLPEALRARGGGICLEPQDRPLAARRANTEQPAGVPWTSRIRYTVEPSAR